MALIPAGFGRGGGGGWLLVDAFPAADEARARVGYILNSNPRDVRVLGAETVPAVPAVPAGADTPATYDLRTNTVAPFMGLRLSLLDPSGADGNAWTFNRGFALGALAFQHVEDIQVIRLVGGILNNVTTLGQIQAAVAAVPFISGAYFGGADATTPVNGNNPTFQSGASFIGGVDGAPGVPEIPEHDVPTLIPVSAFIGLGPVQNVFGDATTVDQAAARVLLDAYAADAANAAWLAAYNANLDFFVQLRWDDGNTLLRRNVANTNWEDATQVVTGPPGRDANAAASQAARVGAEAARDAAQVARDESQAARDESRGARDASIVAQGASEGARDQSQAARVAGVTAQGASEQARDESQGARDESQDARDESQTARDASRAARDESQAARDEAQAAALAAQAQGAGLNAVQVQELIDMAGHAGLTALNALIARVVTLEGYHAAIPPGAHIRYAAASADMVFTEAEWLAGNTSMTGVVVFPSVNTPYVRGFSIPATEISLSDIRVQGSPFNERNGYAPAIGDADVLQDIDGVSHKTYIRTVVSARNDALTVAERTFVLR